MLEYEKRIKVVKEFFENKDSVLGFRKLMDCAIDTQNIDVFKEVIALTDWKENNLTKEDELIKKALVVLEHIAQHPIKGFEVEQLVVDAKSIKKSYGINKFSLGPISLTINKGQVYGLVGENGNGKTTLLRILAKELKHDSGNLMYNFTKGFKNDYELRSKLVYIPQRTQKWYGSLKDNLKFVLSNYDISSNEIETRILMMIARFGLWKYKDLKWSELSSGYKMRFELARTLLRQPEMLLLDEPLANLDVLAQQVILEDLKSMCNSVNNPIALILRSQQLYEVEKVSDKVIFLKNGKYKDNEKASEEIKNYLVVEIDTNCDRTKLLTIFNELSIEKLVFNGGIFVAYFKGSTNFASVLETLGKNKIEVTYLRDISKSTRRFFVS